MVNIYITLKKKFRCTNNQKKMSRKRSDKSRAKQQQPILGPSTSVEAITNLPLKIFRRVKVVETINQLNFDQLEAFSGEQVEGLLPQM